MTTLAKQPSPVESGVETKRASSMDQALSSLAAVARQVRPEHLTKLLDIADTIVQGQLALAALDAATVQRLRLLRAQYDNDLQRAEQAAKVLREYRIVMTAEQQSEMAMLIIKATLGYEPSP